MNWTNSLVIIYKDSMKTEIGKYKKVIDEPKYTASNKFSNRVTIALWIIALSSHAILLPKFLRDLSDRKRQGLM